MGLGLYISSSTAYFGTILLTEACVGIALHHYMPDSTAVTGAGGSGIIRGTRVAPSWADLALPSCIPCVPCHALPAHSCRATVGALLVLAVGTHCSIIDKLL